MEFTSLTFLIFLPLCAALYYILPVRFRIAYLSAVSIGFYIAFEIRLLFVLPFYILLGYIGGVLIEKNKRAFMLFLFLFVAAGVLCFYKYGGMLSGMSLVMPVGISYFTFSTIGYLVDVYTGAAKPEKNFLRYSLFIGFFAQLVAGPIPRTDTLLPQLSQPIKFEKDNITGGLITAMFGYFKKLCVSVPLGIVTMELFATDGSGAVMIFTAILYTVHHYFDFSGYTDIVRGTARIFGLKLAPNFKQPFYSTNFSGFWQRWHISLSKWLQDYIFTPLVWNRPLSKLPLLGRFMPGLPLFSSIFILFVISGVWHGAGLTFLVWGILQAAFRIGEELLHKYYRKPPKKQSNTRLFLKRTVVFLLFSASHVFFAAPDIGTALHRFAQMFTAIDFGIPSAVYSAALSGFNATPLLASAFLVFCVVCTFVAFSFDRLCFKNNCEEYELFLNIPTAKRYVVYYVFMGFVFFGFLMQNGGFGSTANFIYGGF